MRFLLLFGDFLCFFVLSGRSLFYFYGEKGLREILWVAYFRF